jgi:hypothetical protein
MVVLKHNRRQTGLLVVCLFQAMVTGEVLRMMDCGKQAAKFLSLFGFAFLLAEVEAETNITNSAVPLTNSSCVGSGTIQTLSTGNRGLLGATVSVVLTLYRLFRDAIETRRQRKTAWQCVASRLNILFLGRSLYRCSA